MNECELLYAIAEMVKQITGGNLSAVTITVKGTLGNVVVATDPTHGSYMAIWIGTDNDTKSPSGTNYAVESDGLTTLFNGTHTLELRVADQPIVTSDGSSFKMNVPIINLAYLVSSLPDPSTMTYGRAFVSDSNSTTFNAIVAGGGSNAVPVHSDGTNWRIG